MIDEYQFLRRSIIVYCDQLSGIMITIWENTASDLQYHVFFLGVGLARTGSRDSDLTSDEYRSSNSATFPPMLWPTTIGLITPSSLHSHAKPSAKAAIV
jgi:hypothetical protein